MSSPDHLQQMTSDQVPAAGKPADSFFPGFWDGMGWGFGHSGAADASRLPAARPAIGLAAATVCRLSRCGRSYYGVFVASQWARAWNVAAGLLRSAADQALDHADSLARSQADVLWERAYEDLQGRFERLADRLEPDFNLGHSAGGGHGEDPGHPLHWWASFMTSSGRPVTATQHASVAQAIRAAFEDSAPAGPDVGLRVDFEHAAGTLRYSSCVSRGRHSVAEGPSGVIDAPHGVIGCYGQIKAVLRDIGNFIDGSEAVIRDQLRELSADQAGN